MGKRIPKRGSKKGERFADESGFMGRDIYLNISGWDLVLRE